MLIRHLENATLKKAIKEKTSTGNLVIAGYEKIKDYRVQTQILEDVITSSIYGANVNKMLRIATPLHDLENYLLPKVANKSDNTSMYYIFYKGTQYKIIAVRGGYIDIERVWNH